MKRKEEIINQARRYATLYTESDEGNGGDDWEDDIVITFKAGAFWADENPDSSWGVRIKLEREEWLDKACDWLINHNDYIKVFGNGMATGFDMARCVEDFRKAMED